MYNKKQILFEKKFYSFASWELKLSIINVSNVIQQRLSNQQKTF